MKIHLTQPTSSEFYGADTTEEQALVCARNVLSLAIVYTMQRWPDAEVEGRLVPETQSFNNRSYADDDADESREAIIEEIDEYLSRHWYEETLFEEGFDAEAYLAANPR